jgi:hypothetical protein
LTPEWRIPSSSSRSPGVEITALGDRELQVIQPDPELIETVPAGAVGNHAQLHPAARLGQVHPGDMPVRLDVAAGFFLPSRRQYQSVLRSTSLTVKMTT